MENVRIEKKEKTPFKETKIGKFLYKYRWPLAIIASSALGVAGDEIVRKHCANRSNDPLIEGAVDVPFEEVSAD